ncbi:hypothetical protein, partial [Turicibacter sanguinis]|uniref:hypothetical protein n=1 Tax=Turicibacter sanguinis TaxID=154288 RepID=UPI0039913432
KISTERKRVNLILLFFIFENLQKDTKRVTKNLIITPDEMPFKIILRRSKAVKRILGTLG